MKKTTLIMIALLAGICISKVQAQAKASPEEKKAQKALDGRAFSSLKLTDEQRAKILPILIAQNKALDSIESLPPPQGSPQMVATAMKYKKFDVEKLNDAKILVVLTDSQKGGYNSYIDDRTKKEFEPTQEAARPSNAGTSSKISGKKR